MRELAADFVERDRPGIAGELGSRHIEMIACKVGPLELVAAVFLQLLDGVGRSVHAAAFEEAVQAPLPDAAPVEIGAAT